MRAALVLGVLAAGAVVLRRLAARSNTQVHRINQKAATRKTATREEQRP